MTSSAEIQFVGPSWGHHGPYTFFRSFSYRPPPPPSSDDQSTSSTIRSFTVGQFFFVRILSHLPICVAELQLLWESRRSVGTKLASVKLYFTPDSTPSGRLAHHGLDELLVADEKVVLEVVDLVKWVVDGPVTWPYGFQMPRPHHQTKPEAEEVDVAMVTEKTKDDLASSHQNSRNGFKEHDDDATGRRRHGDTSVVIVTYSQYCRCRALAKRLESRDGGASSDWMQSVVVMAMSGLAVARDNGDDVGADARMMFCRETFSHPQLMYHDFRKDRLAPKLKGRKRRRKFSRLDSMESVDSDAGQVAMTTEDDGEQLQQQQRMRATVKRFKGLSSMPSSGIELISAGKDAFEQHLYKFMRERKTPIKRIPSLGFKEVDLFQFFIYSQKFGGYDKVTEGRHWKQIYDQMGGHPGNTSAATCTRRIYEKLLLTFERHVRCEEDKPLPISYMRPARKKLRELASMAAMRNRHAATLSPHDRPTVTESMPEQPIVDDSCVAMVTGDNKLLESTEVVVPIDAGKMESVSAEVSVKVEVTNVGQSLLTDGLGVMGIPLLATSPPPPPPPQLKLKVKLKRGNSPPAVEFKSQILKDQIITGSNGDLPVAPPAVQESTSLPKLNPNLVSLSRACIASTTNRIMQTGSTLSIDQPPIKGDSLFKPHPLSSFPIQFFPNNPFITTIAGVLERPPTLDSTATAPGVVGVFVTTTTAPSNALNNPAMDQKSASKDQVALAPFGFLPPKFLLGSPAPGTTRNPLIRPTYGPPNVVAPFTPTSNGLLVPIFDARPPFLCHPIPNDLQKTLTRRGDPDKPSPAKSDPGGSARPSPGPSATLTPSSSSSSGAWFNSPIKQFLDRTRALTSEARSSEADDQPIDLSVRATQKSSHESTRSADVCTRAEQDEPLNLSRKHEPRAPKPTNLVLPSTKKLGGSSQSGLKLGGSSQSGLKLGGSSQSGLKLGGSSQSGLGRVVLPKSSDLIMPLILSVPSPVSILAQSTAAAFSNVQSLSVAQGVMTNSASQGKRVPASNGLLSTPTVLSSPPFPTSLVGAAIGPVFQFFPSHPLASNIAYASDGGRPVLLRFPMPVPPPSPQIQAAPPSLPPPSLLAAKGNKTN